MDWMKIIWLRMQFQYKNWSFLYGKNVNKYYWFIDWNAVSMQKLINFLHGISWLMGSTEKKLIIKIIEWIKRNHFDWKKLSIQKLRYFFRGIPHSIKIQRNLFLCTPFQLDIVIDLDQKTPKFKVTFD